MLDLEGHTTKKTYHQHLAELEPNAWRPRAIAIAEALRFSPERFASTDAWHVGAKQLLAPLLPRGGGRSISQQLPRNRDLAKALSPARLAGHPARTIAQRQGHGVSSRLRGDVAEYGQGHR
jgi:hypothetical protein